MAHSYVSCLVHMVWSTKERRPFITPELADRLWPYLGGIARGNGAPAVAVGGVADHVHLLVSLSRTLDIAKLAQRLKGNSSGWVHKEFPDQAAFAWQEGYGAFSVGISQRERTIRYIEGQQEHHRKQTFQEEFRAILRRHGIEWDENEVWG